MQEHDDIRVLFQRTGFTQVTHHRLLVGSRFGTTVQLGDSNDRNIKVLRKKLEVSRQNRNFLLSRFNLFTRRHQLQVVDNDKAQIVLLLEAVTL